MKTRKDRPLSDRARGIQLLAKSQRAFDVLNDMSFGDYIAGTFTSPLYVAGAKWNARERARKRFVEHRMLMHMEAMNLIRRKNKYSPVFVITKHGEEALRDARLRAIRSIVRNKHTKNWDNKWRYITFDIFDTHRRERDALRYMIQRYGFKQAQKNMWIFPYETPELIEYITSLSIAKMVLYGTIQIPEKQDSELQKSFGLCS